MFFNCQISHQLEGVRGSHGQGQEATCQPDAKDDQPITI